MVPKQEGARLVPALPSDLLVSSRPDRGIQFGGMPPPIQKGERVRGGIPAHRSTRSVAVLVKDHD